MIEGVIKADTNLELSSKQDLALDTTIHIAKPAGKNISSERLSDVSQKIIDIVKPALELSTDVRFSQWESNRESLKSTKTAGKETTGKEAEDKETKKDETAEKRTEEQKTEEKETSEKEAAEKESEERKTKEEKREEKEAEEMNTAKRKFTEKYLQSTWDDDVSGIIDKTIKHLSEAHNIEITRPLSRSEKTNWSKAQSGNLNYTFGHTEIPKYTYSQLRYLTHLATNQGNAGSKVHHSLQLATKLSKDVLSDASSSFNPNHIPSHSVSVKYTPSDNKDELYSSMIFEYTPIEYTPFNAPSRYLTNKELETVSRSIRGAIETSIKIRDAQGVKLSENIDSDVKSIMKNVASLDGRSTREGRTLIFNPKLSETERDDTQVTRNRMKDLPVSVQIPFIMNVTTLKNHCMSEPSKNAQATFDKDGEKDIASFILDNFNLPEKHFPSRQRDSYYLLCSDIFEEVGKIYKKSENKEA